MFREPTPAGVASAFVDALLASPAAVRVAPGERHWQLVSNLCRRADAAGNLVPDAHLAALALEQGAEWVTADRDVARFPGLRRRHPLDA